MSYTCTTGICSLMLVSVLCIIYGLWLSYWPSLRDPADKHGVYRNPDVWSGLRTVYTFLLMCLTLVFLSLTKKEIIKKDEWTILDEVEYRLSQSKKILTGFSILFGLLPGSGCVPKKTNSQNQTGDCKSPICITSKHAYLKSFTDLQTHTRQ